MGLKSDLFQIQKEKKKKRTNQQFKFEENM